MGVLEEEVLRVRVIYRDEGTSSAFKSRMEMRRTRDEMGSV